MLHTNVTLENQQAFQENWRDWCLGGPKQGGWTRFGDPIAMCPISIGSFAGRKWLSPPDILAKNFSEVLRWHVSYLQNPTNDSSYFQEYLYPRMSAIKARERAVQFINLFNKMKSTGYDVAYPAHAADMDSLDLPFRYFRFDGCHRTACAYVLGIEAIPVDVFNIWLAPDIWT